MNMERSQSVLRTSITQSMDYRVFINFEGLQHPKWVDTYLADELGEFGDNWWAQDVTDYWHMNTRCYYFKEKTQAEKFEFIYRLAKDESSSVRR